MGLYYSSSFFNVLGTEQGRVGTVRIRSRACKKTYDLEVQRVLMSCTCTCGVRSLHMVNGFMAVTANAVLT